MTHARTTAIEGRRLPFGVVHIRTVVICSIRVPIIRAKAELLPDLLTDAEGAYCDVRCAIFIRDGQSRTQERDTVVHEIAHAFLHLTGIGLRLAELCGKRRDVDAFEESLVRAATPHLVALILANGGFSWG